MSTFENADEPTPEMLEMYHQHRCRGIPQTKIAAQFGITQPTVSKHIAKAESWLRNQYREEVSLFRTRITLRLEHLYGEAVQGWEASKLPAVVKTTRVEKGAEVTTIRETAQTGNPAFIRAANEVLGQFDAIWSEEAASADRSSGEVRYAGKSHIEALDVKIKQLQEIRQRAIARAG